MAAPTTPDANTEQISGEKLLEMGDVDPCELIEGRLVNMHLPGVEHGRIEARLSRYLDVFVEEYDMGATLPPAPRGSVCLLLTT